MIKSALNRITDEPDLIGDFSKVGSTLLKYSETFMIVSFFVTSKFEYC